MFLCYSVLKKEISVFVDFVCIEFYYSINIDKNFQSKVGFEIHIFTLKLWILLIPFIAINYLFMQIFIEYKVSFTVL